MNVDATFARYGEHLCLQDIRASHRDEKVRCALGQRGCVFLLIWVTDPTKGDLVRFAKLS